MKRFFLMLPLFMSTSASAALFGFTGFESSTTVSNGASGTITFGNTVVFDGDLSFQTSATGANFVWISTFGANGKVADGTGVATLFEQFEFQYNTKPAAGAASEPIAGIGSATNVDRFSIRLSSTGFLDIYSFSGAKIGATTTVLLANTWYKIEMKAGTGASAAWEVRINGVSEATGTSDLDSPNRARCAVGRLTSIGGSAMKMYFDNLVCDDAAYPSGDKIRLLLPTADGTFIQWAGGATEVDERPPDGLVTVTTCTVNGQVESTAMEDAATKSISGTIYGVITFRDCHETAAVTSSLRMLDVFNTTTSSGTAVDVGNTTFLGFGKLYITDPSTGVSFTTGGIDNLQVGVSGVTCTSADIQCTVHYAEVLFTPSAPVAGGNSLGQVIVTEE